MFSLFNFSSIFPVGSADPICPYVRTPISAALARSRQSLKVSPKPAMEKKKSATVGRMR